MSTPEVPHSPVRPTRESPRPNRIWVRVILVLATVLAILSIASIWANRQLMNPTNWSKTSTALLRKQTIRSALSGYLIDQLYANVDVPAQLKSGLPPELAPLAGPISGALHNLAEQGTERALELPRVQDAWRTANYAADQTLVTIVKGGGSRVQINGGTVSLNLHQIVADLAQRLGLPASVADKLPPSVANLKVVTSSQLGLVRNLAKTLHALALWLTILTFLLYALAMFLARGYRRSTLIWVGSSLVFAGVFVLLARKIGQGQLVAAITSDASVEPAADDAYSVATSLLGVVRGAGALGGQGPAVPCAPLPRAPGPCLLDHRGAARTGLPMGADPGDPQPAGDAAVHDPRLRGRACAPGSDRRGVPGHCCRAVAVPGRGAAESRWMFPWRPLPACTEPRPDYGAARPDYAGGPHEGGPGLTTRAARPVAPCPAGRPARARARQETSGEHGRRGKTSPGRSGQAGRRSRRRPSSPSTRNGRRRSC
jgi:hypothetical protein